MAVTVDPAMRHISALLWVVGWLGFLGGCAVGLFAVETYGPTTGPAFTIFLSLGLLALSVLCEMSADTRDMRLMMMERRETTSESSPPARGR